MFMLVGWSIDVAIVVNILMVTGRLIVFATVQGPVVRKAFSLNGG